MTEPVQSADLMAELPWGVEARIPDGSDPWPCTPELARLLARLVLAGRRSVLEFGAGASSRVMAAALAERGGGRLLSLEQERSWCADAWREVAAQPRVDAMLVDLLATYRAYRPTKLIADHHALTGFAPFDLVLVDAPQWWLGRDSTLYLASPYLAPGAVIVVDDAGRPGEDAAVRAWLASYPGLVVTHLDRDFGGRGVAVLTMRHNRRRPSLRAAAIRHRLALSRARNSPEWVSCRAWRWSPSFPTDVESRQ